MSDSAHMLLTSEHFHYVRQDFYFCLLLKNNKLQLWHVFG